MNISEVSARSGLPTKTIRYYDEIGLVCPRRDTNGYRSFCESEIQKLAFLARSRALGFTIDDCRNLLVLWENNNRASADVKRIALSHLDAIDRKVHDLVSMRRSLSDLIDTCPGDHRPDCPILKDLASP
ncbi:Cu(I)-responsive transcriptional regulator [Litoreibacter arenae]|uniref:Cu(I)-responsive transcriptional regulator n=1 Tax=Litoreibacter arenae TaxID=491388 RepID=UPI0009F916AF|nr:Cu(I)-responsive transcriptional regulator [Litoreibacter arenae]